MYLIFHVCFIDEFVVRTVYLGLGSNVEGPLGNRDAQVGAAIELLPKHGVLVSRVSRRYESKPIGPQNQPSFLNLVLEAKTELEPYELLSTLKTIELDLGRRQTYRWGPRSIDIDILWDQEHRVETEKLHIPHKEIRSRLFVLLPWSELAPDLCVYEDATTVDTMLQNLQDVTTQKGQKIEELIWLAA